MTEHDDQVALFEWTLYNTGRWPELRYMFAVPNGGLRKKATAGKLKAEGAKAGVPDICLPVARGGYHGLYIEMKFGYNTATEAQHDYGVFLTGQGYCSTLCRGYDQAVEVIEWYMGQEKTMVGLRGHEMAVLPHFSDDA